MWKNQYSSRNIPPLMWLRNVFLLETILLVSDNLPMAKTEAIGHYDQGEYSSSKEQLRKIQTELVSLTGEPEIRKTSLSLQALTKGFIHIFKTDGVVGLVKKLAPYLEATEDNQSLVDRLRDLQEIGGSPWGIYSVLNLLGIPREDENKLAAIRYSLFMVIEDNIPAELISQGFFNSLMNGFPWENNNFIYFDPRMDPVKKYFLSNRVRSLPIVTSQEDSYLVNSCEIPAVIDLGKISCDENHNPIFSQEQRNFLYNQISFRPFIIVRVSTGENPEKTMVLMIANHQYLDGVPAGHMFAQSLQHIGNQLGENVESATLSESDLILGDQVERATLKNPDQYLVNSLQLPDELVAKINHLYSEISQTEFVVSYNDFFQLLMLATYGVNGTTVKGGVLGFSLDPLKQLDHFDVGDAAGLLDALLSSDVERIAPYLVNNGNKRRLLLYRAEASNMAILGKLSKLPAALAVRLNEVARLLGIDKGVSGQVMTSIIPDRIGKIHLSGFGGPAVTPFQDCGFTASIKLGSDRRSAESIVIREKMRKKKKKDQ